MESEVARKGVLVNTFHVNSRTSRRLNWQLAMKSALEELDKIEEQSQGRDNILYTVQSADPEPEVCAILLLMVVTEYCSAISHFIYTVIDILGL